MAKSTRPQTVDARYVFEKVFDSADTHLPIQRGKVNARFAKGGQTHDLRDGMTKGHLSDSFKHRDAQGGEATERDRAYATKHAAALNSKSKRVARGDAPEVASHNGRLDSAVRAYAK